jgi:hypothetical protein
MKRSLNEWVKLIRSKTIDFIDFFRLLFSTIRKPTDIEPKIKFLHPIISLFSRYIAEIKSGDSNMIFEIPALVVPLGIEPSTY